MKKELLTTLSILLTCIGVQAAVVMDYQGETYVRPNSVERSLILRTDNGGDYDISIKPLEDALTRSDGEVRIPLEYVYIGNGREDVYMRYNEYSRLFKADDMMSGASRLMTFKVRGYGMLPAGVYNLNFEIQAVDHETSTVQETSIFNMQVIVPTTQEISFHGENATIDIGTADAFAINKKITTRNNPMLYINSNCDWVLTLDTRSFGEGAGNYYIRTISGSTNITERLQERVLIEPYKEIIIARGKAPANNEYVTIELAVEGKNGEMLSAGNYFNNLEFVLSEDRGR